MTSRRTRKPLLLLIALAVVSLGACGGGVGGTSSNGGSGGNPDGSTGTSEAQPADCPTVDYCALRCSGKETPLYPPKCAIPSCSCLPNVPSRSDWSGTYFLSDKVDATNLVLENDGTFRWTIDGCDFGGGGCGIWKKTQPNGIVLLPADGQTEFSWIDRGVHADDQVRVTTDASGELIVEVPEPGEKPTFDRWKKGRVCAECGGNLGPTGQQACTEPVERRCN